MVGIRITLVHAVAGFVLAIIGTAVAPAMSTAAVTVKITSPSVGSTVKGTFEIAATAAADTGDYPSSMAFYDGANSIGTAVCAAQQTCSGSIQWNATGKTGQHTLTAKATTRASITATSDPVTVMIESPPPTVLVTAPANGATVRGTVAVTVAAAVDPSQSDYPTSIAVSDGVNSVGTLYCQGQITCGGAVDWKATGLSGAHTLTARVQTHDGLTAASAPATVIVVSPPPSVRIVAPRSGSSLRKTMRISVAGATDPSQVDHPRSIAVYNGENPIGTVYCQGQRTCAGSIRWTSTGLRGRRRLTAVIFTETGAKARSKPVYLGRGGRRTPRVSCRLETFSAPLRRTVRGVCETNAPSGTRVAIRYRAASGWATVVRGRVDSTGDYRFKLRGTKRASYALSAFVSSTKTTKSTRVGLGTLRVG